ncbi:hypothetical protein ABN702_05990 [Bacillus haimaensis]|uniref:hypothetical protein n=1 Tax=Bacillus haimaensis TaxID=3160967 RepID=UPI003AA8D95B
MMIYKVLLIGAILIFILELFIGPRFLGMETGNTGMFVGLMMLCTVIGHLLNRKNV